MSKLIKKYQSFLENVYNDTKEKEKIETEEETTTRPSREDKEQFDQPSVLPDPLALKDLKDGKRNLYIYNDVYKIEYPSETNCYTVNNVPLSDDPQSVIDYINKKENAKKSYYDAEYEKPELSDNPVTVGRDGKLSDNFFDSEREALTGETHLKESKSYKSSRKFNKRK
jgi:hypothetical protein